MLGLYSCPRGKLSELFNQVCNKRYKKVHLFFKYVMRDSKKPFQCSRDFYG